VRTGIALWVFAGRMAVWLDRGYLGGRSRQSMAR
jgi:hypothetical protein